MYRSDNIRTHCAQRKVPCCTMSDHERSSWPVVKAASSTHSLAVELLRLLVECGPFLHCYETLDSEFLPGLLHSHCPALDPRICLLAICARLLAHDLPGFVLHKVRLFETGLGFLLAARKHYRPHVLTLGDRRHLLGLHGLHGLHCLHSLHCLHGLHGLHGLHCLHGLHSLHGRLLLHHLHGLHGRLLLHHLHGLHGCLLLHHLCRRCLHGLHCLGHSDKGGLKRFVRRKNTCGC